MNFYKCADFVTRKERRDLNIDPDKYPFVGAREKDGIDVRAVTTREFRRPKAGEWYLSGNPAMAYRAPNDLNTEFWILKLVKVQRETKVTIKIVE
jgi:hypothetical protein